MRTALRRALTATAASVAVLALATTNASAVTEEHTYPETAKLNPELPIIHTYHGSDHIKANVLNPRPVCNSAEDFRTTVTKVTDNFLPVGTISTTNNSEDTVKLTQTTNKSQQITLSVNGGYTENTTVNLGGTGSKDGLSGTAGISHSITKQIGASASYSLSWSAGQTIGPYDVPAGYTGEATYGFRLLNMTGTQQYCKPNGTWSTPRFWSAMQPLKNEVRVNVYDQLSDSRVDQGGEENPAYDHVSAVAGTPAPEIDADAEINEGLDLEPYLHHAAGKAEGYAGIVGLTVKNVGTDRYYDEQSPATFRVEVGTVEGPEGVDRLITARNFGGAAVDDLGYDYATSKRVFEVRLSNPINAGDEVHVLNLKFGDGLTKEGRLINDITVTQTGRAEGDVSYDNDWNKVSTDGITYSAIGKPLSGRF